MKDRNYSETDSSGVIPRVRRITPPLPRLSRIGALGRCGILFPPAPPTTGFTPPTTLFADNVGELVERIRPRFNSEYVWNRDALDVVGGLTTDYHTKALWITQP